MEKVKLGDVCKVQGGYAFKSKEFQKDSIPIIRIGNIQDNEVEIDYNVCFTKEFLNKHPEFEIKYGDILIAMSGATVGKIGKYQNDTKALLNQRVGNFIVTEKLEKRYLFFLLQSPLFEKFILNNAFGCAQPNISSKKIEEFEFYNYDNVEQIEIANRLDKTQEIIDTKKKQIELLDELIKSQFVEMFKNIEKKEKLGDLCYIKARIGWQALTKKEYLNTGDYYLVTGVDIDTDKDRIDFKKCSYVSKERYEMDENIQLFNGDVIITKDGTIGKVALIENMDKPATLNSHLFVLRDKIGLLNNIYLLNLLKSEDFKDFINRNHTGTTRMGLNQSNMVNYLIPIPDIDLQNKFAEFVKQIDKQKFEIQKSLEEIQKLQESLMNKYFNGE